MGRMSTQMKNKNMESQDSRRHFLLRALRTTAYAAPLVVAMSMKASAVAQASMGNNGNNGNNGNSNNP